MNSLCIAELCKGTTNNVLEFYKTFFFFFVGTQSILIADYSSSIYHCFSLDVIVN